MSGSVDHVADLIHGLDPGAMVTKFVVVAEVIDTDGDQCVWVSTHEDARPWDVLGLLGYATALENAAIQRDRDEDETP